MERKVGYRLVRYARLSVISQQEAPLPQRNSASTIMRFVVVRLLAISVMPHSHCARARETYARYTWRTYNTLSE